MTLYERDQRNIEKGKEAGRLEGLKEGRAEGEAIARQKQTKDIILRALKRGVSISEIAVILGTTEDDIREFCAENEITI